MGECEFHRFCSRLHALADDISFMPGACFVTPPSPKVAGLLIIPARSGILPNPKVQVQRTQSLVPVFSPSRDNHLRLALLCRKRPCAIFVSFLLFSLSLSLSFSAAVVRIPLYGANGTIIWHPPVRRRIFWQPHCSLGCFFFPTHHEKKDLKNSFIKNLCKSLTSHNSDTYCTHYNIEKTAIPAVINAVGICSVRERTVEVISV